MILLNPGMWLLKTPEMKGVVKREIGAGVVKREIGAGLVKREIGAGVVKREIGAGLVKREIGAGLVKREIGAGLVADSSALHGNSEKKSWTLEKRKSWSVGTEIRKLASATTRIAALILMKIKAQDLLEAVLLDKETEGLETLEMFQCCRMNVLSLTMLPVAISIRVAIGFRLNKAKVIRILDMINKESQTLKLKLVEHLSNQIKIFSLIII